MIATWQQHAAWRYWRLFGYTHSKRCLQAQAGRLVRALLRMPITVIRPGTPSLEK
jgi:hypothetical protein